MSDNVEKVFSRLKNLAQYKNKPELEIYKLALEKAGEASSSDESDVEGMFIDKSERKSAKLLLRKYMDNYSFENVSEKNTVKQLVFLEVFNHRLQTELNTYHKEGQPIAPKTVDALHSNLNQISLLKAQLGIRRDKQKGTLSDAYLVLENLKKKMAVWKKENQGSRTLTCPHCAKMIMLRIRTDIWESQKHPFFIDRFLANKYLMSLYKDGKLSKRDVSKVLETSEDYVEWLLDKVFPKSFKKKEPNEPKREQTGSVLPHVQALEERTTGDDNPSV